MSVHKNLLIRMMFPVVLMGVIGVACGQTPQPTATQTALVQTVPTEASPTPSPVPKLASAIQPRPTSTLTPTPTAEHTPTPTATPVPEPTHTPSPSPTPTVADIASVLPSLTMTATPTPIKSPTPVPLTTFTSDEFEFSFSYPRNWIIDVISPQKIVLFEPVDSTFLTIDVSIVPQDLDLNEYNAIVLSYLDDQRSDLETSDSLNVDRNGNQALETGFEYFDNFSEGLPYWKSKLTTVRSGELGFAVISETEETLFDRHQPTLDAIIASLTLPGAEFAIPAMFVTDATISTGVDEIAEVPIGSGTRFDVSTDRLYSYVMLHNVPLESEVVFDWTFLDLHGNQVPIYNVVMGNTDGTGAVWAWLDIENEIPAGHYESQLYINGELYSASPFTIGLTEFVNERLALSFSYPSAWNIDQSDPTLITLSPRPGFLVQVASVIVGPGSLEAAVSEVTDGFGSLEFQELSRMALDHPVPGTLIGFELSIADTPFFLDSMIKVNGSRFYLVNYFRPTEFENELFAFNFEQLVGSFKPQMIAVSELVEETAELDEILEAINDRVTVIREIENRPQIENRFEDREEFMSHSEGEAQDEESKQDLESMKDFCLILDLCAEADDLLNEFLNITGERVAGYYNLNDKTLTIVEDGGTFEAQDWLTYAHEYTHALQDDRFDLSSMESEEDNFDASKALTAFIEGDAQLVEYLFYETLPTQQQTDLSVIREEVIKELSESSESSDAPRILSETFGWEYPNGLGFIFRMYLEGGFDAVNKAYENPPLSTEQILHFDKYLSGDVPHVVSLPDLGAALGDTWLESDAGVMGELLTGVYLGTFTSEDTAESAAEGWGGDRYVVLKDDQDRRLVAMLYSWDSEQDAAEFFQAYLEFAEVKSEGLWNVITTAFNERMWQGQDIGVYLRAKGSETLVIVGPDEKTVRAVASEFPLLDTEPSR